MLLTRSGDLPQPAEAAPVGGEPVFDTVLEQAVRGFQQRRGLVADGIVGPHTFATLDGAGLALGDRELHSPPADAGALVEGDDVAALQERLLGLGFRPGKVDGVYGERTTDAVRDFQSASGLHVDGRVGEETISALGRLGRGAAGGSPHDLRERERMRRGGPALQGRVVVLDPGHGGDDLGAVADSGLSESVVVMDLARRIESRLAADGARVVLTRTESTTAGDEDERAALANTCGADLVLSLHCDHTSVTHASGVATYFYGDPEGPRRSRLGEELAELVHREIVARTGLLDLRTHPRPWPLLRLTQMVSVRVELGYLSHADDAAALADGSVLDAVADGAVVAIGRLLLGEADVAETGVLHLGELRARLARERERHAPSSADA